MAADMALELLFQTLFPPCQWNLNGVPTADFSAPRISKLAAAKTLR